MSYLVLANSNGLNAQALHNAHPDLSIDLEYSTRNNKIYSIAYLGDGDDPDLSALLNNDANVIKWMSCSLLDIAAAMAFRASNAGLMLLFRDRK